MITPFRLALWVFLSALTNHAFSEILPPGNPPVPYPAHALTNAKVVTAPNNVLDSATILIRDGKIEAAGAEVEIPADARVWDLSEKTVYPGLIDIHLVLDSKARPAETTMTQPIRGLTAGGDPFYGVPGQETDPGYPGPGSPLSSVRPQYRIVEDYSPDKETIEKLHELGFTTGNLVPTDGIFRGQSALVNLAWDNPNKSVLKAETFQHLTFDTRASKSREYPGSLMGVIATIRQTLLDVAWYEAQTQQPRRSYDPALEALRPVAQGQKQIVIEPGSVLMTDRASKLAGEFELNAILLASGHDWRRTDLLASNELPFIVPVNFPELPKIPDEDDWNDVSLDQLRHWDWSPENPVLIKNAGHPLALTTCSLSNRSAFRKKLRAAIDRGLTEADALAALTTIPARLCGVEDLIGTIEPGKLANLIVVDGDYFDPKTKIKDVWVEGRHYPVNPGEKEKEDNDNGEDDGESDDANEDEKEAEEKSELLKQRVARSLLEDRGVLSSPGAVVIRNATIWTCGPEGVLRNADLIIVGDKIQSVGPGAGENFDLPGDHEPLIIDAEGKHVTPGLIDAHSHSMILGGVNESTLPSTAMVRIGDVVNSETENIYYQLAGGLTVANLLHGSANPIGGQNAVIKLRYGAGPDALIFDAAPPGIKFALGENVKQSNWGNSNRTRFPQTRMGVRTFFENRFLAAQHYLKEWENFRNNGGPRPRRDLELEALGEILEGERWIHCHSYRQDEILMLIRLMGEFGVRIATFQHVLEGYKVADEIAQHGAGGSSFSDWWAYKYEVIDAIPYNGTLMHDRGVLVSFNSDSSDLARRMNLEAAKAVKYGGLDEEEALKFVTLNPAKQLRIDDRVGSLEPNKDADFVLWTGSPLDTTSVCLETWIDGKKYFDRSLAPERIERMRQEREELIAKAKKIQGTEKKEDEADEEEEDEEARAAFFQPALETSRQFDYECQYHLHADILE